MASLERLVETLQRAKDGPPCSLREWEMEVIPQTVKKYLEKYELQGTFRSDQPVNQDQELADRFFQAGLELATDIGLLLVETETMIKVSREEILRAIEDAPDHLDLGEGEDRVIMRARSIGDENPPIFGGPLAIQVSEEFYVPLAAGILQSRDVGVQIGPSIDTIYGRPIYSGTAFETVAGIRENSMRREAQGRAGRPGIANEGTASSTTEYGLLGGFAGLTREDNPAIAMILHPAELKAGAGGLHKIAAAIGYGGYIDSGTPSMIGDYSGGAEGAALSSIASMLLHFTVLQADISEYTSYDIRFDAGIGRHGVWANSVSCQALSRNTHLIKKLIVDQCAGPGTVEILQMSAAGLIAASASGASYTIGVRSAGGRFKDYITPLEHWVLADIFRRAADLSLEKANELVLYLLSRYEDKLKSPPKGKSFSECFDLKTMQPEREWAVIADDFKRDLEVHGFPFS